MAAIPPNAFNNWLPSSVSVEITSTLVLPSCAKSANSSRRSTFSSIFKLRFSHFSHCILEICCSNLNSSSSVPVFSIRLPHDPHFILILFLFSPSDRSNKSTAPASKYFRTSFSPYAARLSSLINSLRNLVTMSFSFVMSRFSKIFELLSTSSFRPKSSVYAVSAVPNIFFLSS